MQNMHEPAGICNRTRFCCNGYSEDSMTVLHWSCTISYITAHLDPAPPASPCIAWCISALAMQGQLPNTLSALLQAFDLNRYGVATAGRALGCIWCSSLQVGPHRSSLSTFSRLQAAGCSEIDCRMQQIMQTYCKYKYIANICIYM